MDVPKKLFNKIDPEFFWSLVAAEPEFMLDPDHCPQCRGVRWICAIHRDKPYSAEGCECSEGEPCPLCNPCDHEHPPASGFDGGRYAASDLVLVNDASREHARAQALRRILYPDELP